MRNNILDCFCGVRNNGTRVWDPHMGICIYGVHARPWPFPMKVNYNSSFKLIWWIFLHLSNLRFWYIRLQDFQMLHIPWSLQELLQAWVITHTMCKRATHRWASWRDAKMCGTRGLIRWLRRRLLLCSWQLTKDWGCVTFLKDETIGTITKCAVLPWTDLQTTNSNGWILHMKDTWKRVIDGVIVDQFLDRTMVALKKPWAVYSRQSRERRSLEKGR